MATYYKNRSELAGNLVADPVITQMPSGDPVVNATIATVKFRPKKDSEGFDEFTEFHNLTLVGYHADKLNSQARKGANIAIEGEQRTKSYEDRETGKKVYKTYVYVTSLTVISNRTGSGVDEKSNSSTATAQSPMDDHADFIAGLDA